MRSWEEVQSPAREVRVKSSPPPPPVVSHTVQVCARSEERASRQLREHEASNQHGD